MLRKMTKYDSTYQARNNGKVAGTYIYGQTLRIL
jgi:hypothetical protein